MMSCVRAHQHGSNTSFALFEKKATISPIAIWRAQMAFVERCDFDFCNAITVRMQEIYSRGLESNSIELNLNSMESWTLVNVDDRPM